MLHNDDKEELIESIEQLSKRVESLEGMVREAAMRGPGDEELLTIAEASRRYKVSQWSLYRLKDAQVRIKGAVRICPQKMGRILSTRTL